MCRRVNPAPSRAGLENELMKSTGMVRCVDELGRIVIPKEMRRQIGIDNTDPVEFYVDGDKIVIEKYRPLCHFCSSSENVTDFKGRCVCRACIEELSGLV